MIVVPFYSHLVFFTRVTLAVLLTAAVHVFQVGLWSLVLFIQDSDSPVVWK